MRARDRLGPATTFPPQTRATAGFALAALLLGACARGPAPAAVVTPSLATSAPVQSPPRGCPIPPGSDLTLRQEEYRSSGATAEVFSYRGCEIRLVHWYGYSHLYVQGHRIGFDVRRMRGEIRFREQHKTTLGYPTVVEVGRTHIDRAYEPRRTATDTPLYAGALSWDGLGPYSVEWVENGFPIQIRLGPLGDELHVDGERIGYHLTHIQDGSPKYMQMELYGSEFGSLEELARYAALHMAPLYRLQRIYRKRPRPLPMLPSSAAVVGPAPARLH